MKNENCQLKNNNYLFNSFEKKEYQLQALIAQNLLAKGLMMLPTNKHRDWNNYLKVALANGQERAINFALKVMQNFSKENKLAAFKKEYQNFTSNDKLEIANLVAHFSDYGKEFFDNFYNEDEWLFEKNSNKVFQITYRRMSNV